MSSLQNVYKKYFEKVYRTTFYILKNEEIAKDATQETFVKVFKNLHKLKKPSKIESWITTVATRTAIDIYRKNNRRKDVEFIESRYPSETEETNSSKEELDSYLNNILPEQKQILVMKYMEEMSEKEIAKRLKLKLGTVKSRLFRAKKKLLEEFQSKEGFENG